MWHYWKITGPNLDQNADWLLTNVVEPALAELAEGASGTQFHFLRYAAPDFHLRLRVQAKDRAQVERFLARIEPMLTPGASLNSSVYEPEIEKYGGDLGLQLAERWFTLSSLFALKTLRTLPEITDRAGLLVQLLRDELNRISADRRVQHQCLSQYRTIWLPYVRRSPALDAASVSPEAQVLACRWVEASASYHQALAALEASRQLRCPRASFHLNMIHLLANRCGLGPSWEVTICDHILNVAFQDA